jgi:hypothetical protein
MSAPGQEQPSAVDDVIDAEYVALEFVAQLGR